MTTIITKNGSGAPTAGQLTTGELAVDLTNKELYTKDSGGNVIKVGAQGGSTGTFTDLTATSSFTSPGIDDNATSTAITIDASQKVGVGTGSPNAALNVSSTVNPTFRLDNPSGIARFNMYDSATFVGQIAASTGNGLELSAVGGRNISAYTNSQERMVITSTGDVTIGSASTYLTAANRRVLQATGGTDGSVLSLQGTSGDFYVHSGSGNTANVNVVNRANGYMNFFTNNTERMRIDASGNLGIGGTTAGNAGSINVSVGEPGSTVGGLQLWAGTSGSHFLQFGDAASGDGYYRGAIGYLHASDALVAYSAGTERMRIDASGNVGIGRTPATKLDVQVTDNTAFTSSSSGNILTLRNTSSTAGSFAGIALSSAGTGGDVATAHINVTGTGSGSGDLVFSNRSSSTIYERMRIDASGNLLVGKTAASGITSAGFEVNKSGVTYTSYSGTQPCAHFNRGSNGKILTFNIGFLDAGGINATQYGTPAFVAASDERLKDNIVDHESELANVMALRPTRWDWKDEVRGSGEGFIAQELEQTAWSDLVTEGDDGYKQVAGLGTVETRLIKAIQEQQAMIETLQAEVAALKGA